VTNIAFIVVDAWLGSFVITDEPVFDPDTARELGRALVSAVIWVPYIRVSKRVTLYPTSLARLRPFRFRCGTVGPRLARRRDRG
jgi:hypothetical protein